MTVNEHYHVVDSTNTKARTLLSSLHLQGSSGLRAIVSADIQTAGRGRLGRTWVSSDTQNFYASYVCEVPRGLYGTQGSWLPTLAGLATLDALREQIDPELPVRLKWPNDLYLNEKKLGGILCEVVTLPTPDVLAVIMGIGLNLSSAPEPEELDGLYAATSLNQSVDVRGELRGRIGRKIHAALTRMNANELRARAKKESCILGQAVRVQLADGTTRRGRATDITPSARLELDGAYEVSVGDVLHTQTFGRENA